MFKKNREAKFMVTLASVCALIGTWALVRENAPAASAGAAPSASRPAGQRLLPVNVAQAVPQTRTRTS